MVRVQIAICAGIILCIGGIISSCTRRSGDPGKVAVERVKPVGPAMQLPAPPLGLPPVPVPVNNPPTAKTVALGRDLFFDKRLSLNNSISCSSCHDPQRTFTDGRRHSTGVGGKTGRRNAPSVLNAAYGRMQFWDGRAKSLEEQVGGPMADSVEMNQPHEVSVSKLNADPATRARFEEAFGPGPVTIGKIEQAIASFERTLVSADSPFDRYEYGGDKSALSPAAIRGLAVFKDPKRGNCTSCHVVEGQFALFTDGLFHNIGVGVDDEGNITDIGRYGETHLPADKGSFKTPSLRDVALTAPYMHDGSLKTLKDVVDFYAGHGNSNPNLDPRIKAIKLDGRDRSDLVEFLKSLSSKPLTEISETCGGAHAKPCRNVAN
jgi:cytochrome c peroxidase